MAKQIDWDFVFPLGMLVLIFSLAFGGSLLYTRTIKERDAQWEKCLREAPPGYTCYIPPANRGGH